jgi:hypothetical protein
VPDINAAKRRRGGWYDNDAVYIPTKTLAEAAGRVLPETQIASLLQRRGDLRPRGDQKRIAIRYVPKVGHIDCYALKRSVFGRNDAITDLRAVGGNG